MEVNSRDLLYFESPKNVTKLDDHDPLNQLASRYHRFDKESYFSRSYDLVGTNFDFLESFGMAITTHS